MSTLFNLYDYIFFAFVAFFALVGLARGFWVQFFATLVWIIGGALYYVKGLSIEQSFLSGYMSSAIAHWFMFAIVVVSCLFVNFVIRFLLGSLFKINAFTFFNKMGGLIFGACSSAFVVVLTIYAVNHSEISQDSVDWKKSYVVVRLTPIINKLNEHDDNEILPTANGAAVSQVGNFYEVA